ncbi:GRAM domain-containing protein [Cunninghamella echinulata]|nr:GRAM domain-containing protein [Cunninghamella echinulata]
MEEPNTPIPSNAILQPSSSTSTTMDNNTLTKTLSTSTTNSVSSPSITTATPTTTTNTGTLPDNCPIASEKENQYFHALFKSVPENDRLIEIYKCALHRDILLQGHLYISEHHICFHANIFGWITNLVIEYNEIVLIERRMTAMIIPNGIQIDTQHAKHTFASFIYREAAYQRLVSLWELHQQQLSSSISSEENDDDDDNWSITSGEDDDDDDNSSVLTSSSNEHIHSKSIKHHHHHKKQQDKEGSIIGSLLSRWKGIILCLLFLHSAFLIKQWLRLERQLQRHHRQQQHFPTYFHSSPSSSQLQPLEDHLSLSEFLMQSTSENQNPKLPPSLKMNMDHHHHELYQKLDQLRLKMDGLNQQIINQQLNLYDLSLNQNNNNQ